MFKCKFLIKCESHLGYVFDKGPAPFFKKLLVNSASLHFLKLNYFLSPKELNIHKKLKNYLADKALINKKAFYFKDQMLNNQNVVEYFKQSYEKKEYETTFKSIGEKLRQKSLKI